MMPSASASGRGAQHGAAARRAEDDLHAVHVGELGVGGDGALGAALGVLDDEFQRSAVDAAGGVDLVGGHLLGLVRHGAVGFAGSGQRFHHADAKSIVRLAGAGDDEPG